MSKWTQARYNPPRKGFYLVWCEGKFCGVKNHHIAHYNGDGFWTSLLVTHWMELPDPPVINLKQTK